MAQVGSGSEVRLIGSEGLVGGSKDDRVNEGVKGGAKRDCVCIEVSRTDGVCSEFAMSWSCAKVGEEGSGISG